MHPARGVEDHGLEGATVWGVWLPVLGYLILIFGLSSIPHLSPPEIVGNSDKIAHFLEYGILGLLFFRAFRRTWQPGRWRIVLLAVLIGGGLAALDEIYQGTVGRNRSLADWTADVAGLASGSWAAGLLLRGKRTEKQPEPEKPEPSPRKA